MTYDMSNQMAFMACDHRNIENRESAYQNAINKTVEWAKNHSAEEIDMRIADLMEAFQNKDVYNGLYAAGMAI